MSTDNQPENIPETIEEEEVEESPGPCEYCGEPRMGDYTEYCVDCYWDAREASKRNCSLAFTSTPNEQNRSEIESQNAKS